MQPMEGDAVLERSIMPAPVEDVTASVRHRPQRPDRARGSTVTAPGRAARLAAPVRRHRASGHLHRAAGPRRSCSPDPASAARRRPSGPTARSCASPDRGLGPGAGHGHVLGAPRGLRRRLPSRPDARRDRPPAAETLAISTFRPGRSEPPARSPSPAPAGGVLLRGPSLRHRHRLGGPDPRPAPDTPTSSDASLHRGRAARTEVHAFALDGRDTRYVASGDRRRHRPRPLVARRARRVPPGRGLLAGPAAAGPATTGSWCSTSAGATSRRSAACGARRRRGRSSRCAGSTTWPSSSPSARSTRSTRST